MKLHKHPLFGIPPYGTAAFFKERQRTRDTLFHAIAWLLIGLIFGAANIIISYKYVEAGLGVPVEQYLLAGVYLVMVVVYLPYFIQGVRKLRSLNKEYFQYLEGFRKIFNLH